MKTTAALLSAALVLSGTVVACQASPAKVDVYFSHPENFTDVSAADFSKPGDRDVLLYQLQVHLVKQVARLLPADQRLMVIITDVDLAGMIDPFRRPQLDDTRIISPVFPSRINLEFILSDATGRVLVKGRRNLHDSNTMNESAARMDSEYTRYEKILLTNWLINEFRLTPVAKS